MALLVVCKPHLLHIQRFTGNQIAKLNIVDPVNIRDTEVLTAKAYNMLLTRIIEDFTCQ